MGTRLKRRKSNLGRSSVKVLDLLEEAQIRLKRLGQPSSARAISISVLLKKRLLPPLIADAIYSSRHKATMSLSIHPDS
jgi:hypothetical protein